MKILMIGDVFAKPGRKTIEKILPKLKKDLKIDLVIANVENVHHGKGVSDDMVRELQNYGVDVFTSGNHIWDFAEIIPFLDMPNYPLIRPSNFPKCVPGRGYIVVDLGLKKEIDKNLCKDSIKKTAKPSLPTKVAIINLIGRVFMKGNFDDPFSRTDEILDELKQNGLELGKELAAIVIDFHAETTSEKEAFAHYLDGRVTGICGTHTHVQTSDEKILPAKTAYITDLGMVGVEDSVLGSKKEIIIKGFLMQLPVRHEIAKGKTCFGAALIETEKSSGLAKKIERIFINSIDV